MTSVKTYLGSTAVAMALSVGVLSAPAHASVSTPFGSVRVGGFGLSTPWGGGNVGGFGVSTPWGGGNVGGFGVSTPWGGGHAGGFGMGDPNLGGGHWGGFGLSAEQALSIKTPFGSVYGPGFGISTPWGGVSLPGFGVSTPWGGGNFGGFGIGHSGLPGMPPPFFGLGNPQFPGGHWGGFGVSTPWGGGNVGGFSLFLPPPFGFGISTPWGGVNTPIFGLQGQPTGAQPQVLPVMVPYPVPMQGGAGAPGASGAQPTQCMINAVPALTKSVDDCEKAGGAVPPTQASAVQAAKK